MKLNNLKQKDSKSLYKRIFISLLSVFIIIPMFAETVSAAQSTTFTYAVDRRGWLVRTQDAYLPEHTITNLGLKKPEDIFFDDKNNLYIADTGNKRIVVYNTDLGIVTKEITNPALNTPRGVYVTKNGNIYVADSSASAAFCFSPDGELLKTFERPDSPAFGDTEFKPYRIAVDLRGSLYIIGEGVYNGIIQLSVEGEFLGYFSSNKSSRTFVQFLQDIFFTDAQKAGLIDRVPTTFSNVFTDKRGIVYSTSMGEQASFDGTGVKKHNMAGTNMFKDGVWSFNALTDLTVDKNGIIYAVDISGKVFIYAPDGEIIFMFGGDRTEDDIAGLYSSLMGVAIADNGQLWTVDNEKSFLQSYSPSEYTLSIFKALKLFDEGNYVEAGNQWEDVLRYNQMSSLAHYGLGKSLLYRQIYDEASEHFEIAGYRYYYSQSFWETRNEWLLANLYWILIVAVVILLAVTSLKYIDRKHRVKNFIKTYTTKLRNVKILKNVFFTAKVSRHPLDAYYYLKRKQGGSFISALVCFLLFFFAFIYNQIGKAFILQYVGVEDMDVGVIVGGFFAIFALFIVCNYLVTSIKDGEGTILQIFQVISYGLFPAAVSLLTATLLTYIITFNEIFLLDAVTAVGFLWSGVLIYLGLQEVHNYNVKNNVISLIITAAFILIVIIIVFNLTILGEQFGQFFEALTRELITNVQKTY